MIYAVAGFLFSEDKTRVALIRKKRPVFHAGMLNAIGGKLKEHETYWQAMNREFLEETGVLISNWDHFLELHVPGWTVKFFRANSALIDQVRSTTDEEVSVHQVADLKRWDVDVVPNLKWMIPMALSPNVMDAVIRERNNV